MHKYRRMPKVLQDRLFGRLQTVVSSEFRYQYRRRQLGRLPAANKTKKEKHISPSATLLTPGMDYHAIHWRVVQTNPFETVSPPLNLKKSRLRAARSWRDIQGGAGGLAKIKNNDDNKNHHAK
jgi:hypothetical protein